MSRLSEPNPDESGKKKATEETSRRTKREHKRAPDSRSATSYPACPCDTFKLRSQCVLTPPHIVVVVSFPFAERASRHWSLSLSVTTYAAAAAGTKKRVAEERNEGRESTKPRKDTQPRGAAYANEALRKQV